MNTKQYFKLFARNINRNKNYYLVIIGSLIVSFTCSFLLFGYVANEFHFDKYHKNPENIYRISITTEIDDKLTDFASIPPAFGDALKSNLPEIEYVSRLSLPFPLNNGISQIKLDNQNFYQEDIYMADADVFEILTFDLLAGDKTAFSEPFQIILSESLFEKLYKGKLTLQSAIGQTLEINEASFNICGVMKDVPFTSHMRPQALISWEGLGENNIWDDSQAYTFVRLNPEIEIDTFQAKLDALVREHEIISTVADSFGAQVQLTPQRITDIHLYSDKQYEPSVNATWSYLIIFIFMGAFFLIACAINYLNLSIAIATKRFTEIGIRKVFGASPEALRRQFLFESVLIAIGSALLSFILFIILIPQFNNLINYQLSVDVIWNWKFICLQLPIILLVGLGAGTYQAMYLSRMEPGMLIQNKEKARREKIQLRQILSILQFVTTSIVIVAVIVINSQVSYILSKELGFEKENIITVKMPDSYEAQLKVTSFKNQLNNLPSVAGSSMTDFFPGITDMLDEHYVEREDGTMEPSTVSRIFADPDLMNVLSLELIEGRAFESTAGDYKNSFMVNEAAIKAYGWNSPEEALGKKINGFTYEKQGTVIGVVKDANLFSLKQEIRPLIFNLSFFGSGYFLYVKVNDLENGINEVKEVYENTFNSPFNYSVLHDQYQTLYSQDAQVSSILELGAIILSIIAGVGIFALSIFNLNSQRKSIAVRKVVGANNWNIISKYSSEFVLLILLANLAALPLAHYLLGQWLDNYAYRVELKFWMYFTPLLATVILGLISISNTLINAIRLNPVLVLKDE